MQGDTVIDYDWMCTHMKHAPDRLQGELCNKLQLSDECYHTARHDASSDAIISCDVYEPWKQLYHEF